VARVADGWMPLLVSEEAAATTRMPALATVSQLADAVDDLRGLLTDAGRDPFSVRIQVQGRQSDLLVHRESSWEQHHDFLGELEAAGVTDVVIRTPGTDLAAAVDALQEYGREGLAVHRG
jgi:hypothetical protein